jgi:hypothetical protein
VHFFLEADRGTMPVVRSGLTQTSFYRKLIAYEATWTQKIHQRHLGIHRFRVLTVADVILVDPAYEEFSIGFNILSAHSDHEKTLLASDLVSVFERLYAVSIRG